jgi:hypothetical protein
MKPDYHRHEYCLVILEINYVTQTCARRANEEGRIRYRTIRMCEFARARSRDWRARCASIDVRARRRTATRTIVWRGNVRARTRWRARSDEDARA